MRRAVCLPKKQPRVSYTTRLLAGLLAAAVAGSASAGITFVLRESTADSAFNMSTLGPGIWTVFQKDGPFAAILSGAPAQSAPWLLLDGAVSADNDAELGLVPTPGSLTFNGGTLRITGTTFTGTDRAVNVMSSGGTFDIVEGANTLALSQPITGTGTLTKMGAGGLALNADSSAFTGATSVSAGTLIVNGNLGGSALNVASGATLNGTGTVGATTIATGATIAIGGTAIGTLNVHGDLTLSSGSTYQVRTNPTGTDSDLIKVSGQATIAGSLAHIGPDGSYQPLTTYTIISAAGGVQGKFGAVSSTLAYMDPTVTVGQNDVTLQLQRKDVVVTPPPTGGGTPPPDNSSPPPTRSIRFADLADTANERSAANALESLNPSNPLYVRILNLEQGQPAPVFNALSGEVHASAVSSLLLSANTERELPLDHFRAALAAPMQAGSPTAQAGTSDVTNGAAGLPSSSAKPAWAQLFGSWQSFNGNDNTSGARQNTGGLFVGADHAVGGGWRLGGALGYTSSDLRISSLNSDAGLNNYSATIYGGKAIELGVGTLNLLAGGAYAWHDINTKRSINVAGLNQQLRADYGGTTGQVFTELGYALKLNPAFTLEPFAGLAWSDLHTNSFSESGGSTALSGQSQHNDMTTTTLGLRAQTAFILGKAAGHLTGSLGWRHAFGDVTPESTFAFDGSQSFTEAGTPIAKNSAVAGLGVDFAVSRNATVGVAYNGEYGGGNRDNAGSVDVKWSF